ncbi:MAG: hypothetical protein KGR99_00575 [Betaproteobacteria bacterium]|nr:hypothetical protein [Betaproteobacteria bacterium]MDE2150908.1 hypothetical protein [Betaproteobacteria bacterium]
MAACLLACAWLAGCVPIPIPPGDIASSRRNIGDGVPAFIVTGRTARSEVLLVLGEPDRASEHEELFTYQRVSGEGGVVLLVAGPGTSSGGAISAETVLYRFLTITFDRRGLVTSARSDQVRCRQGAEAIGERVAGFGTCAYPPGQAQALARFGRVFVPSQWLQGVAGYAQVRRLALEPPASQGALVIGGSGIEFFAESADADSKPLERIAYADVAGISLDSFGFGKRLVIELRDGSKESFSVLQGDRVNPPLTVAAFDLAKARWQEAVAGAR